MVFPMIFLWFTMSAMPGTSSLTFHQGAARARRARHFGGEAQPRQRHSQALGDQAEGLGPDLRGVTQKPWEKMVDFYGILGKMLDFYWDFGKKWWISMGFWEKMVDFYGILGKMLDFYWDFAKKWWISMGFWEKWWISMGFWEKWWISMGFWEKWWISMGFWEKWWISIGILGKNGGFLWDFGKNGGFLWDLSWDLSWDMEKNGIHRTMNKYFGMQLRFKNDKETV